MLFLLLLSMNLWAQDIVIQSENVSDIQFEQYLLENPHKKSYVQNYNQQQRQSSNKLLSLLKKAQYEFLDGSLEKAKSNFMAIHQMKLKEDWDLNQRKTIHYALFRLAQLETDPKKKGHYITEALIFDDSLAPDQNLFPPPLVVEFHKIKNKISKKIWPLPPFSEKFSQILINGKIHTNGQSFVQTTQGVKRFSFISNKYKPIHLISDIKNLSQHKLATIALAQGSCDNPRFLDSHGSQQQLAYFGKDCELPTSIKTIDSFTSPDFSQPTAKATSSRWRKKSTWAWIGVTILAAAVTWKALENQGRSDHPASKPQPSNNHISN